MSTNRGKIIQVTNEQIVTRAKSQIGKAIQYHLEYPNGGTDPDAASPADPESHGCDCIGYALWAAGFDRYQPGKFPLYDGYINTDSMIDEALTLKKWFSVLDAPKPGCFIVGHTFNVGTRRVIGHIGIVTEVNGTELTNVKVAHCSPGNYGRIGNSLRSAVWETAATVWGGYPHHYWIEYAGAR